MEFVRQYVTRTLNVVQIRYAKIVYVSEAVVAILHVLIMKLVLTNNVEVGKYYFISLKMLKFKMSNIPAPCESATTCGPCADCRVINHGVQCSCMAGFNGNPLIGCSKSVLKCDGICPCDLDTGLCIKRCTANKDCSCGEICHKDTCTTKCSSSTDCPTVMKQLIFL